MAKDIRMSRRDASKDLDISEAASLALTEYTDSTEERLQRTQLAFVELLKLLHASSSLTRAQIASLLTSVGMSTYEVINGP